MKKTEIMKEAWLMAKEEHALSLLNSLIKEYFDLRWLSLLSLTDQQQFLNLPWIKKRNAGTTLTLHFYFIKSLKVVWALYNEDFYKEYGEYSRVAKLKSRTI